MASTSGFKGQPLFGQASYELLAMRMATPETIQGGNIDGLMIIVNVK